MTVCDERLQTSVLNELGVAAAMPESERQHPHQRTVSVRVLVRSAGADRRLSRAQPAQRMLGLHSAIEDVTVDRHVATVAPIEDPPAEIVDVEQVAVEEAGQ